MITTANKNSSNHVHTINVNNDIHNSNATIRGGGVGAMGGTPAEGRGGVFWGSGPEGRSGRGAQGRGGVV